MLGVLLGLLHSFFLQVVDPGPGIALFAFGYQVCKFISMAGCLPDKRVHKNAAIQPDTIVPVQPTGLTSPLLRSVFATHLVTEWWLEETSTFFKVGPRVDVLISSRQMERRFGTSPVVIEFRAGKGRVLYNALGHQAVAYETQELKDLTEGSLVWALGLEGPTCP